MAEIHDDREHPALSLPEPERLEYAIAVASLAYADRRESAAELEAVRRLCGALAIGDAAAEQVLPRARALADTEVSTLAARFRDHFLRQALLTDSTVVALADRAIEPGETARLAALARAVGLEPVHAAKIAAYVGRYLGRPDGDDATLASELSRCLCDLEESGVPKKTTGALGWLLSKFRS